MQQSPIFVPSQTDESPGVLNTVPLHLWSVPRIPQGALIFYVFLRQFTVLGVFLYPLYFVPFHVIDAVSGFRLMCSTGSAFAVKSVSVGAKTTMNR